MPKCTAAKRSPACNVDSTPAKRHVNVSQNVSDNDSQNVSKKKRKPSEAKVLEMQAEELAKEYKVSVRTAYRWKADSQKNGKVKEFRQK